MARDIRPLEPDDIPEVSRFLVEGFRTPADADFAAPDVLHWKYLEPRDDRNVARSLVARDGGRIIGHGGMTHGWFQPAADPARRVSTMHGIDWISSPGHRNTGLFLLRRGHRLAETHYALNYNESARRVIEAVGYQMVCTVPVFRKVLRPGYRFRTTGHRTAKDLMRTARDAGRLMLNRGRPPVVPLALRRVSSFGIEIEAILAGCTLDVVVSSRQAGWLNHILRYPRGTMTGWLLSHDDRACGFALLNVARRSEVRIGKIVECFLGSAAPDLWHSAIAALTQELKAQGADVAETFGSTTWMARALQENGFSQAQQLNFLLNDPQGLLPKEATFHLTPFEADYGYT
jgi:hypothetical protein